MSRCYPYPPPYLLESEIRKKKDDEKSVFLSVKDESIKKREEKDRKKEKKREKKEKKEKKKKVQNLGEFGNKKHTQKEWCKDDGSKIDHNGGNPPKRREDEDEVEKSGLSEEHDQPTSLQNLGNISDSSQDSRKRKRTHIPMPTSSSNGCHNLGNVLRFRLSMSKDRDNKDQVVVLPPSSKLEKSSCSSERPERVVQNRIDDGNLSRSVLSQLCSTSGTTIATEILRHKGTGTPANCLDESCLLDTVEDTQYRNLIENWIPPSQSLTAGCTDLDDQDWLFGSHRLASSKRVKATSSSVEEKAMLSSGLWPTARYLPDADIYALPYTIPY